MTFTRETFRQFLVFLEEDSGARSMLQRIIEPESATRLREAVQALAEAQDRAEARLGRLEATVHDLAEAQTRAEARLGRLEATVRDLAEAQARTEARLETLAEAQVRTEARLETLAEAQRHTEVRLERLEVTVQSLAEAQIRTEETVRRLVDVTADLQGTMLEFQVDRKAGAYFGTLLRRVRVVPSHELADQLDDRLSRDELSEVLLLDVVVTGRPRTVDGSEATVWLAVEVSSVVDVGDVDRAHRRAQILRRAGLAAIPAVVGSRITAGAVDAADAVNVVRIVGNERVNWEAAVAMALSA